MDDASIDGNVDRGQRSLPAARTVTCPTTLGAAAPWQGNSHRSFGSLTGRLDHLGAWLDEAYRVPADEDGNVP